MFNHYVYILWLSSNIYFGISNKAESSADVNKILNRQNKDVFLNVESITTFVIVL